MTEPFSGRGAALKRNPVGECDISGTRLHGQVMEVEL